VRHVVFLNFTPLSFSPPFSLQTFQRKWWKKQGLKPSPFLDPPVVFLELCVFFFFFFFFVFFVFVLVFFFFFFFFFFFGLGHISESPLRPFSLCFPFSRFFPVFPLNPQSRCADLEITKVLFSNVWPFFLSFAMPSSRIIFSFPPFPFDYFPLSFLLPLQAQAPSRWTYSQPLTLCLFDFLSFIPFFPPVYLNIRPQDFICSCPGIPRDLEDTPFYLLPPYPLSAVFPPFSSCAAFFLPLLGFVRDKMTAL